MYGFIVIFLATLLEVLLKLPTVAHKGHGKLTKSAAHWCYFNIKNRAINISWQKHAKFHGKNSLNLIHGKATLTPRQNYANPTAKPR